MGFFTIYCQNIGLNIGSPNISVYYFGTSKYFEQLSVWLHPFNLFINHLVPHLDRLQAIMFTNVCQFSLSSQEYFPLICCLSGFPPPSFEMFKMGNNFQQEDDHLLIFSFVQAGCFQSAHLHHVLDIHYVHSTEQM